MGWTCWDGKSASTGKRGYVIAPRGRLEVEGFRRSYESVAAFRFGSVAGSYAQRSTGSSRNVGVIGAAVYKEENTEWRRRTNADPFPGRGWQRGSSRAHRDSSPRRDPGESSLERKRHSRRRLVKFPS